MLLKILPEAAGQQRSPAFQHKVCGRQQTRIGAFQSRAISGGAARHRDPDLYNVGTLPCFGTESIPGPGGRFGAIRAIRPSRRQCRRCAVSGHLPDQGAASADAAKASPPVCFWTSAFRPVLAVEYVRRSGYFAAEVEFANNRQLSPKPVNPLRARALGREQALRQTTVWGAEGRLRRFLAPSLTKHRKAGQGSPCAHLTGGG